MITVRKVDLAERLDELLDKVAAGDAVEVVDAGAPVARIVKAEGAVEAPREIPVLDPQFRHLSLEEREAQFVKLANEVRAQMPKDLTVAEMMRYRDERRR